VASKGIAQPGIRGSVPIATPPVTGIWTFAIAAPVVAALLERLARSDLAGQIRRGQLHLSHRRIPPLQANGFGFMSAFLRQV
jgi:hypothetical protein